MQYVLIGLLLVSCGHVDIATKPSDTFVTKHGVIVHTQGSQYLTKEITSTLEDHLLSIAPKVGWKVDAVKKCISGVQVLIMLTSNVDCEYVEHDGSKQKGKCVGFAYMSKRRIEIYRGGQCGYSMSAEGPTYEHELAHLVMNCIEGKSDKRHNHPIWELLDVKRECPKEK